MQPHRFLSEHVEHLSRGPLAGLDTSVEIPLAVRRGVFPGEQRVPLRLLEEPPEVRVLAGSEPGIRAMHPRIVHPGVEVGDPVVTVPEEVNKALLEFLAE